MGSEFNGVLYFNIITHDWNANAVSQIVCNGVVVLMVKETMQYNDKEFSCKQKGNSMKTPPRLREVHKKIGEDRSQRKSQRIVW